MKEQQEDATNQKRIVEVGGGWVSRSLELNKRLQINLRKISQETEQKNKEMKNASHKD